MITQGKKAVSWDLFVKQKERWVFKERTFFQHILNQGQITHMDPKPTR